MITTTGNELSPLGPNPADGSLVGNRTLVSTVYSNKLGDRLEYVAQADAAAVMKLGRNFEKVLRVVTRLGLADRCLLEEGLHGPL